jgi:NitT/TauT family transport system substrate-binding protein
MPSINHGPGGRGSRRSELGRSAAALLLVAALAACGGGDGDSASSGGNEGGGGGELTRLDVGILPIVTLAPIALGVEKGFCEDEGLDVELNLAQGGSALVPAVASGQYGFGFSNNLSLMVARGQGLPLRIVAAASRETRPPDRFVEALMVGPNSDVQSPADLANSTIAVNTLNSLQQAAVQATLEEAGVDLSTVEFVEIPLPDIPVALQEGRVDAGHTGEPFVTVAEQQGSRVIADSYEAIEEGLDISSWFTTDTFLEQNPDVAESFIACMDTARVYADENPEEIRAFLPEFMNVDPALAQEVQLGEWPEGLPKESSLQGIHDAAVTYGMLEEDALPDPTELLYEPEK